MHNQFEEVEELVGKQVAFVSVGDGYKSVVFGELTAVSNIYWVPCLGVHTIEINIGEFYTEFFPDAGDKIVEWGNDD